VGGSKKRKQGDGGVPRGTATNARFKPKKEEGKNPGRGVEKREKSCTRCLLKKREKRGSLARHPKGKKELSKKNREGPKGEENREPRHRVNGIVRMGGSNAILIRKTRRQDRSTTA